MNLTKINATTSSKNLREPLCFLSAPSVFNRLLALLTTTTKNLYAPLCLPSVPSVLKKINTTIHKLCAPLCLLSAPSVLKTGLLFICILLSSCQQKIDVKIPDYQQKLVVEGKIEPGTNPQVYLSYTVPYFGNHTQSLADFAVKGAFVTVTDGTTTDTLKDVTLGNGYWYKASTMIGVVGKTYNLMILLNGKTYTAQTTIHPQVKLDTLWFKVVKFDSLGFIYTHIQEPGQTANQYRWLAKRIGKDADFIAPLGSSFDDKFINGKSFEFAYDRGMLQNSTADDDNNNEKGLFKKGDQVIVKFCTIGYNEFRFFRSYDANIISNGNPFAAPSNLQNNIQGENVLGVWCGYNPFIDTVLCK